MPACLPSIHPSSAAHPRLCHRSNTFYREKQTSISLGSSEVRTDSSPRPPSLAKEICELNGSCLIKIKVLFKIFKGNFQETS